MRDKQSSGIWYTVVGFACLCAMFLSCCAKPGGDKLSPAQSAKMRHSGSVVMPDGTVRSESKLRVVKP